MAQPPVVPDGCRVAYFFLLDFDLSGAWLKAEPATALTALLDLGSLSSFAALEATLLLVLSLLAMKCLLP